jgi:hypothetical protein
MIQRVLKSVFLILAVLILVPALARTARSQTYSSIGRERPFEPAEELLYKAEFSRSLLRKLDIATFKLTVVKVLNPNQTNGPDIPDYTLKLTGDAVSQGFFPKLFGLTFHQRVESTVEPNSFVVQRTTRVDEQGKRIRSSEAVFDHEKGQVTWVERDPRDPSRPERKVIGSFVEPIQDILSAIYFLRTQKLEPGKRFAVDISDSGKMYKVPLAVIERKRMKTPLGRLFVLRIDPELFGPRGMVAEDGKFSIWITDDSRRIPVSARLKLEYGTFDITLKKASQQPAQTTAAADRY